MLSWVLLPVAVETRSDQYNASHVCGNGNGAMDGHSLCGGREG